MLKKSIALATLMAMGITPLVPASPANAQEGIAGNDYWWPNRLDLSALRGNSPVNNPLGADFNYADAFASLDLDAVVADLKALMVTSQDWWPADYGHYGPFFVRMSWHNAGTYRTFDGRGGAEGGMQRFAPLNSWPDNANLDKAQRLLWPIKQKYGDNLSWGDLVVLAGTIAMEDMGFDILGFAGGRVDGWEPEDVYWGSEKEWLGDERHSGDRELEKQLGATQLGLIYVNPEGPNGTPDPLAAARDIRQAFARMAMDDEETAALIAGGHTFGKAHGAASTDNVGDAPEAGGIEQQGLGWANTHGSGNAGDTISSGLEGAWTVDPTAWTNNFLQNLYGFEWQQTRSPAGAIQWIPTAESAANLVPDAHDPSKRHSPIMFTTDLALRFDPAYNAITSRWLENPEEFADAYARAWFKLTHRDMGPSSRYIGELVPEETFTWQDPVPEINHTLVNASDIVSLKTGILNSGLTVPELVRTAWASASSFRGTDYRGGANGARLRLAPQKDWTVNQPEEVERVLDVLADIQNDFNHAQSGNKQVSLADLIVLGGAAAIEKAAADAGQTVEVPFVPGRMDASQEQTDVVSFAVLEPTADGFRNYFSDDSLKAPAEALIEKAEFLSLSIPEMTVLVGGLRSLDANADGVDHGVFTNNPGTLNRDFFVNVLDMSTKWAKVDGTDGVYEGIDRASGQVKWTATPVDLIFASNSELRVVAEVYAHDSANEKFLEDFVSAWNKVMTLDRFDL